MRRSVFIQIALISGLALFGTAQSAELNYPTKPIKIVVGWAPGGQADTLTRTLADLLEKYVGKTIVVENKPGGASGVATAFIAKTKPDGYTLGAISDSPLVRIPHMRKVTYHPTEDIIPVIRTNVSIAGLVVRADSPLKTFQDFLNYAKKNPGKLTFSHPGSGSSPHLGMGALEVKYGIKCSPVPYKGDSEMITALLGGHVMAGAGTTGGFGPYVKSGDLRLLAIFSKQRIKFYPDVPTLGELGYKVTAESNFLIIAPKGTPAEMVEKIQNLSVKAMKEPSYGSVADKLWTIYEPILTGEELKKAIKEDDEFYGDIIKTLGIKEE
jgi:tripartite-type tricarboxylate transporter receptor subunit TctC